MVSENAGQFIISYYRAHVKFAKHGINQSWVDELAPFEAKILSHVLAKEITSK